MRERRHGESLGQQGTTVALVPAMPRWQVPLPMAVPCAWAAGPQDRNVPGCRAPGPHAAPEPRGWVWESLRGRYCRAAKAAGDSLVPRSLPARDGGGVRGLPPKWTTPEEKEGDTAVPCVAKPRNSHRIKYLDVRS